LRDPEQTRTGILRAAFNTVYQNGFRASSVNDIVEKAGVTEGAFFHYFSTKNELGYALADEVLRDMMVSRWIKPLAAYRNPIHGMIIRFRKLMEETSDEDLALGCPLNNLTQEMSPIDPVFREKLQAILKHWIHETERYLRKAQADGYMRPDINARQAAEFIVMAEEGSAALVKNLRERRAYWSLFEMFKQFLLSISTETEESKQATHNDSSGRDSNQNLRLPS
jgi:TetR/AcrR family transcriptional regulator, transcriptional repressor for nem operon